MIKEASRIPLTIILLRTICMIKGISVTKDSGIEKNIYKSSNEELIYNDEIYDNNVLNYDNEHFLKNIETRQSEGKEFKHSIANTNEKKKENIISSNNYNIVRQNKENPIKGVIEKTLDSDIFNRRNCVSNLQSEKRSPLSYFQPNQELDNKIHPKMYIFNPEIVDVGLISRFTGKKNYVLPICNKNEYPSVKQNDNYHDYNGQSHFIETKNELDSYNIIHNSKTNPNIKRLRNMRSQWKMKSCSDRYNTNDQHNYNKYKNKSPVDYLHINKISDMNNEKSKFTDLQMNTIDKEDSYAFHRKMNTMLTEENIISNNTKADISSDQVLNSKIEETSQVNKNITGKPLSNANSVSGAQIFTNNSELDKLHKAADNNLLISNNKNNLISSVEVKHTPYYTRNVNTIVTDLTQDPKSKSKISTFIPSPTPLNEAVKSNESYIFIQQPVPGPNSAFLQKAGISESLLPPNISSEHMMSDTIIKNENTTNDLITISIDPKTLQNKILHAEFLKQSDVKKKPDTLSIELEPKEKFSQSNAAQQTVSNVKPIQISASKKNNSIIITGGDIVKTGQNQGVLMDLNESQQTNEKNQQDLLDKRFKKQEKDKSLISRMANARRKKSISISSIDINDEYTTISTKIKRDAEKMNVSKLISMLKPVIVLRPNEDETGDIPGLIDQVNLKGSPEVNFEKGNKKVENKILEGFINSIIANYSKDETKQINRETTEKNEEEAGALFKLLENNIPKRIDTDELDDKMSDIWNLTPILVPESSISKFDDNSEYAKLGPFDENLIKSFLEKDSIPYLQEEKL